MSQIGLPLAWPADPREDAFLVTPSNARAAHALDRWGTWPIRTMILTGPRKSGRSLLSRIFAKKSGGQVIDGAESRTEADLFHAWNEAQATRRPLLLISDAPPPAWDVSLPDLRSRLAATPVATIGAPDDALMRALFERLFLHRGLDARPDLLDWLVHRVERSHVAVIRAVDVLDQEVLERRKRLSIPFARSALAAAAMIAKSKDPT